MSTPHNNAGREQIAGTVIMPGDPLRAKFIAETYLACPVLFNDVRGMYGYTGEYRGKRISVMGSGMGMPSMGIYSYELFHFYNVENIIRIGSAGSYCKELNLLDLLLVTKSYSESTYALVQSGYNKDVAFPSEILNHKLRKASEALGKRLMEGMVHSTDVFYREYSADYYKKLYGQGCLAVEMESFALFHNAAACKKQAACLLTISDSFVSSENTTAEQRQNSFTDMIETALEAAVG